MKTLARLVAGIVLLLATGLAAWKVSLGEGRLPDRSTPPRISPDLVQKVADLDFPPGNIAVSEQGRVFLTLHPDGHPPAKVVELVDGKPRPFPGEEWQHEGADLPWFQSVLSIRIDRAGLLWVLDFADYGRGQPRLLAFRVDTKELVHRYDIPREAAGLGSMLNDFQVSPDGLFVFIAETSPVLQRPAILVLDTTSGKVRRLLDNDPSVRSEKLDIHCGDRRMMLPGGLIPLRIAVDSIALSRDGQWLYYGAVTGSTLWRVRTADLLDEALLAKDLAARVQRFADKTLSDGLTTDDDGNVYVSDMEHSAIHRIDPSGRLETLVAHPRLRWPDGFSFGPNGWLYASCSALQDVLFQPAEAVRAHAPYQVWKLQTGTTAAAGH